MVRVRGLLAVLAFIAFSGSAPAPTVCDIQAIDLGDGTTALQGSLAVAIGAAGILTGWFVRPDGTRQAVEGGRRGSAIWFDIGRFRATGTLRADGKIEGYATLGRDQLAFTASPVRAP